MLVLCALLLIHVHVLLCSAVAYVVVVRGWNYRAAEACVVVEHSGAHTHTHTHNINTHTQEESYGWSRPKNNRSKRSSGGERGTGGGSNKKGGSERVRQKQEKEAHRPSIAALPFLVRFFIFIVLSLYMSGNDAYKKQEKEAYRLLACCGCCYTFTHLTHLLSNISDLNISLQEDFMARQAAGEPAVTAAAAAATAQGAAPVPGWAPGEIELLAAKVCVVCNM